MKGTRTPGSLTKGCVGVKRQKLRRTMLAPVLSVQGFDGNYCRVYLPQYKDSRSKYLSCVLLYVHGGQNGEERVFDVNSLPCVEIVRKTKFHFSSIKQKVIPSYIELHH